MAEQQQKKPVEAATAAPGERRSAVRPPLAKAAEATDGTVQWLLGERYTAYQNGDKDREAWATAQLAELGYE